MQTRVLRPGELGQAERDAWDVFLHAPTGPLASPFLTPKVASGRRVATARVAVVEDAGEPVAFLAFSSSDDGTGARSARRSATRKRSWRARGSTGIHQSWSAPRA